MSTQQDFKNSMTQFHLKDLVINNIKDLGDDLTFGISESMLQIVRNIIPTVHLVKIEKITKHKMMQIIDVS